MPNPFAPRIDPATHGVAGAVVFLRNFDPAMGRPWDFSPARVEVRDGRLAIIQGDEPPRAVGFTRRGDDVAFASTDPQHRMIRARGAAFFTLPFPDSGRPLVRRLDHPGWVELTGASGEFGSAADLFVSDHPYYAVTGPDGGFILPQVPAGERELGVWVRNWRVVGQERDPESGLVARVRYAKPAEVGRRVEAGRLVDVHISAADFPG